MHKIYKSGWSKPAESVVATFILLILVPDSSQKPTKYNGIENLPTTHDAFHGPSLMVLLEKLRLVNDKQAELSLRGFD